MITKFKISTLSFLTVAVLLASCDSFFEVDDRELPREEDIVANDGEITNMWMYMYTVFENGFEYIGGVSMLANACDEADFNQQGATVQLFSNGSWNDRNNPGSGWYYSLYRMIRHASKFLELTDVNNNPRFDYMEYYYVDEVKYNQMVCELKAYRMDAEFFKAYCHFELMKRFGEIPIVDRTHTEDEAKGLKRNSIQEVTEYIVGKIDALLPMYDELEQMPTSEYTGGTWTDRNLGRITKGAALALKVRTLIYAASPLNTVDGNYDVALCDRAARAAAEIINMGIYSTDITYRNLQFNRLANNPENILDARNQVASNRSSTFERWNYPKSGLTDYVSVAVGTNATCPSQNLVDAYERVDGSAVDMADPFAGRDPRFGESILYNGAIFNGAAVQSYEGGIDEMGANNQTTTGYYLKKFVQNEVRLDTETVVRIWYIFRYSDILLYYAEAMLYAHGPTATMGYVTNGPDLSATDAVNLVRGRDGVNMPPLAVLTEELLRNERRVELAFEGHRFWDVRRWKIASTTENAPLMGMQARQVGSGFIYEKVQVETRTFEDRMYRYPIPYDEMVHYPQWNQNEGW